MRRITTRNPVWRRGEEGSLLLETVIVIPLYLLLIGGTMWVGDLILARQKLVIADRYAAWNLGCRYEPGGYDPGTIRERFFKGLDYEDVEDVTITKQVFDWSHAVCTDVKFRIEMPEWILSWFGAGEAVYGAEHPTDQFQGVTGRTEGGGHTVVMRTKAEALPDYIRNKYGIPESGEVAMQWEDIADEKWPFE